MTNSNKIIDAFAAASAAEKADFLHRLGLRRLIDCASPADQSGLADFLAAHPGTLEMWLA